MPLRVVIVDELPLLRAGIAAALAAVKGLDVVDSGTSLHDTFRLDDMQKPDILVIGLSSIDAALSSLAKIARSETVKIICLIEDGQEDSVTLLLQAGVAGCLTKSARPAELIRCLEAVLGGGRFVSPSVAAAALSRPSAKRQSHHQKTTSPPLTRRETAILELVARGQSNKDIAQQLLLSEKTVKRYMTLIMHKINVRNRVQAALFLGNPGAAIPAHT